MSVQTELVDPVDAWLFVDPRRWSARDKLVRGAMALLLSGIIVAMWVATRVWPPDVWQNQTSPVYNADSILVAWAVTSVLSIVSALLATFAVRSLLQFSTAMVLQVVFWSLALAWQANVWHLDRDGKRDEGKERTHVWLLFGMVMLGLSYVLVVSRGSWAAALFFVPALAFVLLLMATPLPYITLV